MNAEMYSWNLGVYMEVIKISVRNLVEFILREGDIDNRRGQVSEKNAMEAGSRIHRKIQKSMGSFYRSEVPLTIDLPMERFVLRIEGRADGIMEQEGAVTIDEIKGIYKNVEDMEAPVYVHKAQAMVYAYIYATEHDLNKIGIQMTYCNLETEQIRRFQEKMAYESLQVWFLRIIDSYMVWADYSYNHREARQTSISGVEFPYQYRAGQRDMVVSVYSAIRNGKPLFVQAPTGIGKTLATIFPAVKAMGQEMGDKIFYLTAKTITRTVAVEGFEKLREQGLQLSSVVITAKEKSCMLEECNCNPDACPYAKGHYDRVNDAVYDCITHEWNITREVIMTYAERYQVCPFEFCLDVSLWVDGIICDYNYVFDPTVNLKRYFAEGVKGDYIFLVDEAHNLYERASSMYSAELYKEDFLELKNILKPYSSKLAGRLQECNKILLGLKKECEGYQILDSIQPFLLKLMSAVAEYEAFLEDHHGLPEETRILEFYFQLYHFLNIYERVDENYVIYCEQVHAASFKIKLYCVDTSKNLKECLEKGRATIFFSATLLPIRYYKKLLSEEEDYAIYIPSPFRREHMGLMIGRDVSSRYSRRGRTEYQKIYQYIEGITSAKKGNYMVFFPSYKMLEDVYAIALEYGMHQNVNLICQSQNMKEEEREAFLEAFEGQNVIGFCIMGGIFSEGIDLTGERLIGAIVVGTGLPMVCNEREILMHYFEEREGQGFEYAYLYPGMNKVLQAAGRVIRTASDRGIILLLDERFLNSGNRQLFPREWEDYQVITVNQAETAGKNFWDKFSLVEIR